jgi:hypothetical protein
MNAFHFDSTSPLTRRSFLRASGIAVALPLLEAMRPRLLAAASPAAQRRRMVCINTSLGIHTPFLYPEKAGRDYALTPYLEPLAALRQDFTVCSGLSHPDVDGGHAAESSYLTAAPHPGSTGFRNSISLDQFAAERAGADTRFSSLVLRSGGGGSLSWSRAGVPIPAEERPSKIFARLFLDGSPAEVAAQVARLRDGQSIMDAVGGEAKRLSRAVGPQDREKLDEYFTSVRELEQRLVKNQEWAKTPKPVVQMTPPKDSTDPSDIIGRSRVMYGLIALALQNDSTRLVTLSIVGNNTVPPIKGVTMDHHGLSHHGKNPEKIEQLRLIELAEMQALAEFLTKLKAAPEDGGSVLDKTMVFFGSNLGNASSHDNRNMPVLLAGGGFKHGQHLSFDQKNNGPLPNLFVSMLQRLGVETDTFATGKGTLTGLEAKA